MCTWVETMIHTQTGTHTEIAIHTEIGVECGGRERYIDRDRDIGTQRGRFTHGDRDRRRHRGGDRGIQTQIEI